MSDDHLTETGPELPSDVVNRRTLNIFGWIIGFFIAIWLVGFNLSGPLCTFIYLKIGAREKWPISIILAVATGVFVYVLFDQLLHVPFPPGLLFNFFSKAFSGGSNI